MFMCCIINNYYCHTFYTGASGSDVRGNSIPRCDINNKKNKTPIKILFTINQSID